MSNPFSSNPHKAAAKIRVNNTLIGVCLTIFGILWTFAPDRMNFAIMLQFIMAVPLLYVSSISYTKIAYWKNTKLWDYFGWFTGTTATAFVLNIIGILTFMLGYVFLSYIYFALVWVLLAIYTSINIYYNKKSAKVKIFNLVFFVSMQMVFGIGVLHI